MPDKLPYEELIKRNLPEYQELLKYLTARGVQPQGRVMKQDQMSTVDQLMQEMATIAQQQMTMQASENKDGSFAKESAKLPASNGATGATDFRILLDLATRELQAQQPKPRPIT